MRTAEALKLSCTPHSGGADVNVFHTPPPRRAREAPSTRAVFFIFSRVRVVDIFQIKAESAEKSAATT